jgi:uncharacterized protein YutE (UPF0331/DUF86 family)
MTSINFNYSPSGNKVSFRRENHTIVVDSEGPAIYTTLKSPCWRERTPRKLQMVTEISIDVGNRVFAGFVMQDKAGYSRIYAPFDRLQSPGRGEI